MGNTTCEHDLKNTLSSGPRPWECAGAVMCSVDRAHQNTHTHTPVEILASRMRSNQHRHPATCSQFLCVHCHDKGHAKLNSPVPPGLFLPPGDCSLVQRKTLQLVVEGEHHVEFLLRVPEFVAFLRQRVLGGFVVDVMLLPCTVLCGSTLQSLNIFTSSQPQNWRRRCE